MVNDCGINTNDVGIVLQGPTTYAESTLNCYRIARNVVWSTWEDEPAVNINAIKESGIKLNLTKKPAHTGYLNINLQCLSTYTGILELAKNPDIKYFVKIRSDFVMDNIETFLEEVKCATSKDPIAFLGYVNYEGGYLLDYIAAGSLSAMINFWTPEIKCDSGYPAPEIWLQNRAFPALRGADVNKVYSDYFPFIKLAGYTLYSIKWCKTINEIAANDNSYIVKV